MDGQAEEILEFWETIGPKGWYEVSDDLDDTIRSRFKYLWSQAKDGKFNDWQLDAKSALSLIILVDQFPRNMFRGHSDSFATDSIGVCVCKKAIDQDLDQRIDGSIRQFFYLPLMHSESMLDQDASVRAFVTRMDSAANLKHARAHREVIREFGRFPYRNEALGRKSTVEELAYLAAGGYGYTLKNLED